MTKMTTFRGGAAAILGLSIVLTATPGFADTDAMDRRDDRQDGRQGARDAKDECKDGDTSRAECRQQKRDTKQDSRGDQDKAAEPTTPTTPTP